MRIVTWNCNRQLGRKLQPLLDLAPDIAVVQECEKSLQVPDGFTYKWTGVFPNMGLGVLARDPQMRMLAYDEEWTFFLPVELPSLRVNLLATWAFNHRAKSLGDGRIGTCLPVIDSMAGWLAQPRSIMAGDFNQHPRWDTPCGRNNFRDVCSSLSSLGLKSAYHTATGEAHGAELQSTLYLHRKHKRPYHIDYCFVHSGSRLRQTQVGAFEEWRKVSDHVPVIVDVEMPNSSLDRFKK